MNDVDHFIDRPWEQSAAWPYRPATWVSLTPGAWLDIRTAGDAVIVNEVTLTPDSAIALGHMLLSLGVAAKR